jgi:hypothetical protein
MLAELIFIRSAAKLLNRFTARAEVGERCQLMALAASESCA